MKIGEPAVELLIDALWHAKLTRDSISQDELAIVLSLITRQNFGEDPAKWREWWEKNKEKF